MSSKNVIVYTGTGLRMDLVIPTDIPADTLIHALFTALLLPGKCPDYIRAENPVAFICGKTRVDYYDIRDGSILYI